MVDGSRRNDWTEEQTLVLFNAYLNGDEKGFGNRESPVVLKYSKILGRSPGSIKAKMENIRTANPAYTLKRTNSARYITQVWMDLLEDYEGAVERIGRVASEYLADRNLDAGEVVIGKVEFNPGADDARECRVRKGQGVFRLNVANNFERRCCITGIAENSLLVASHIVPWSESSPEEKTDPRNGLFLNRLHDGLFDRHLMTIDEEMRVVYSDGLEEGMPPEVYERFFKPYEGGRISEPVYFEIDAGLLARHNRAFQRA